MADEIEEWRKLYRHHLADDAPPSDDELVELVAGNLQGEERARLADRVVASRRGSEDYRLLQELHREAGQRRGARSSRLPARTTSRLAARITAIAAVLLLVAGLTLWIGDFGEPPADVTRGGALNAAAAAVEPADESEHETPPSRFAWPSQPGAAAYRVELRDSRADLIWRSPEIPPSAPQLDLPAAVGERLRAGEAYFWVVQVDDGARPALGPFWFHLAERRP